MKMLASVLKLSLPARTSGQVLFSMGIVTGLLALEVLGRAATSDVQDGLGALALVALAGVVAFWHRRRPLDWVNWLIHRVQRFGKRMRKWKYEHGIDFRGTPPLPHRLPAIAWWIGFGLLAWGAASVGVWYLLPGGWRDIGVRTSYVFYLLILLVLWSLLFAGLLAGLFVPMMLLDRRLRESLADSDRRVVLAVAGFTYIFAITGAAAYFPVVGVMSVCGLTAAVALVWCIRPGSAELALLWRARRSGQIYSVPAPRLIAAAVIGLIFAYTDLILTGLCGRLLTNIQAEDAMPLTGSLAALVAWTTPGLLLILAARLYEGWRSNPSQRTPPTMHVQSPRASDALERITEIVSKWGYRIRADDGRPKATEVGLQLVHPELSEATEFDPRWPLKVSLSDLQKGAVRERFDRRDEIQLRRRFFRGLRTLMKQARTESKSHGGGYWLAPHWWFFNGLGREEGDASKRTEDGEGSLKSVGPPFSSVFGRRARQHLHRVLRGVEVDVIYIEDGVSIKQMVQVFRALLEVYDVYGGKKRVDDHSFVGIPKVRVIVHELSPEKPSTAVKYRQPKFDDLSRGRVLHVFRDRGDSEELSDTPFDFSSEPSPMLMV
jgi:hypothetical protein